MFLYGTMTQLFSPFLLLQFSQSILLQSWNYNGSPGLCKEVLLASHWFPLLFMLLQWFDFVCPAKQIKCLQMLEGKFYIEIIRVLVIHSQSLPYCICSPSINDVSSTPSNLCVTFSAVLASFFRDALFFFSNFSFQK
jgi:hypothetical protein